MDSTPNSERSGLASRFGLHRLARSLSSVDFGVTLNRIVDQLEKPSGSIQSRFASGQSSPSGVELSDSDIVSQTGSSQHLPDDRPVGQRARGILPATARIGFLGAIVIVTWWSWPREAAPKIATTMPIAAIAVPHEQGAGTQALAIVNPAYLPGRQSAPQVAGAGSDEANFSPSQAAIIPMPIGQPTPSQPIVRALAAASQPRVTVLTNNDTNSESEPILARMESQPGTSIGSTILVIIPTPTPQVTASPEPTATSEPAKAPSIGPAIPTVVMVPPVGGKPTATAAPAFTTTPAPTPSPPPLLTGRGRLWSSFTPLPAAQNDHFWVGAPFLEDAANQLASPNYQFGSNAQNRYRAHHGLDYSNPRGTPVRAGVDGEVVHAGLDDPRLLGPYPKFYGNAVVIRLDRRLPVAGGELDVYVLFGHLNDVLVTEGQRVQPDDIVGLVGMTGIAIGPHLHLEMRLGANTYQHSVNPYLWVTPMEGTGAVAVRLLTADGHTWAGSRITLARFSGGAAVWARQIETYLDTENIGPDPAWGENGAMDGVPAGHYTLVGTVAGEQIRTELDVRPGETTFVEIRTQQ